MLLVPETAGLAVYLLTLQNMLDQRAVSRWNLRFAFSRVSSGQNSQYPQALLQAQALSSSVGCLSESRLLFPSLTCTIWPWHMFASAPALPCPGTSWHRYGLQAEHRQPCRWRWLAQGTTHWRCWWPWPWGSPTTRRTGGSGSRGCPGVPAKLRQWINVNQSQTASWIVVCASLI